MTPPNEIQFPPDSSTAKRILIGIAGLILLTGGALITLGTELVGVAAIVIVWFLMRRRNRRLTRAKAWLVSVGAIAGLLVIVFAVNVMSGPTLTTEQRQRSMAAARARTRDSMPEVFKKIMPPQQQQTSAAADSIALRLIENRGFMAWMAAMSAVIGSGIIALFAGTLAWGAWMLLFRAFTDEWMTGIADPPTAAREA